MLSIHHPEMSGEYRTVISRGLRTMQKYCIQTQCSISDLVNRIGGVMVNVFDSVQYTVGSSPSGVQPKV